MENRLKQALINNKDISEKLLKSKTKEEAYKVVKDLIPGYSIDDMAKDLKEMNSNTKALSIDDMQAVSGGVSMEDIHVSNKEFLGSLVTKITGLFKIFK